MSERRRSTWRGFAAGVLVAALLCIVPLLGLSRYWMKLYVFGLIYVLLILGIVILLGFTGQVSLGQGAFYGIGAYLSGIASTRWEWPFLGGLVLGAAVAALLAYVIGRRILHLEPFYLAMATLVIGSIVVTVFNQWTSWTGGPNGITGIPRAEILGWKADTETKYAYLCIALVLLAMGVSYNLSRSRVGRGLQAIRADQMAASSLGVDIVAYKARVFALAGAMAAIGGSLYTHFVRYISPETFGEQLSIDVVVAAVVGGIGYVGGALVGAAALIGLPEVLQSYGEWNHVIFGCILYLTIRLMPSGVFGALTGGTNRLFSRRGPVADEMPSEVVVGAEEVPR